MPRALVDMMRDFQEYLTMYRKKFDEANAKEKK